MVECKVWSVCVGCGVSSAECGVQSVKCGVNVNKVQSGE